MTFDLTDERNEVTSPPVAGPKADQSRPLMQEELNESLQALAIPFDSAVVRWRVTGSDDRTHGLMLPTPIPVLTATGSTTCSLVRVGAASTRCRRVHRFSGRSGTCCQDAGQARGSHRTHRHQLGA